MTDYPYRFDRTSDSGQIRHRYSDLEAGTETEDVVRLAGRVMTTREHGKIAFADIQDAEGRMQLFAQQAVLGDEGMEHFKAISVGDIVGADGVVMKTRRGELSVKVSSVTVLAKCRRPMPEKWHGMTDVETRYRQRYLDLITNPEARRLMLARVDMLASIRAFMDERGFMEVETPLLQPIAGGAVARPFVTHHNALNIDLYLRIAPELYLKRLLIGGAEKVYEVNRSFRNEGISTKHNPEFTMLEGYEAYVDWEDTMALVEDLVRTTALAVNSTMDLTLGDTTVDLSEPFPRITMFEAIERALDDNLEETWRNRDVEGLRASADRHGVKIDPKWGPGKILVEIFEQRCEKDFVAPTFICGFPKEVSPLAKDHRSIPDFTEQADLLIDGLEIAPIYSELNDPEEQRRRFEQQAAARAAGDEEAQLPDEDFLEALEFGMPPAGGFGFGVDRMLAILTGAPSLREIILFPTLRPE